MIKRFVLPVLFMLAIPLVLLAGCSERGGDTAGGAGDSPRVYTIADSTGDWGFPSPYGHYSRGPGYIRMSFIFDTLVWKDASGFVPALAENWWYDEASNTYTFNLRRDITWHDGEKFTARDVVFTVNYMKEHPYSMIDLTAVESAAEVDDYTVKIKLDKPYAPFLENVAGTMPVLPEHIWRDVQEPESFTGAGALVGTGPFKLVDYSREHGTYLYEAYDDYYGGRPLVDRIRFVKVSEEMAMSELQKGGVNAAEIKPETVEGMEKAGFTVISGPSFWNAKLMINHKKEPFSSPEFRRALAYAIDRGELVDVVARGHAVTASPGMIPPDTHWHNPKVEQYRYNPEKARELLGELGYELRDGVFYREGRPLEVELLVSERFARDGELIAVQLAGAGIKVELRSLEAKTLDNRVQNWEFELALSGHGGIGGDPVFMNQMITGENFNSARYNANQELNKLLEEQVQEMDLEARKKMVDRLQEVYAAEVPALSLYYPRWYFCHDGGVELYYTAGGIGTGVPLPLNKMAFVNPER